MITAGPLMQIHGKHQILKGAPKLDARSLHIECPKHPGLLMPVTGIKFGTTGGSPGKPARDMAVWMEALCRLCNRYQYFSIKEGSVAGLEAFRWNI